MLKQEAAQQQGCKNSQCQIADKVTSCDHIAAKETGVSPMRKWSPKIELKVE